jgi:mannose-6-phosphate isomerase-like protein (cupin superfamily)
MRQTLTCALTLGIAAAVGAPLRADDVTHVAADKVKAAFGKAATLVDTPGFAVVAARRDTAGEAESHADETDVFYVVAGTAVFVTGGEIVDPREISPGQTRGARLKGGIVRTLRKGDVIVIPAKTPHWFREVRGEFLYFVVKPRPSMPVGAP